MFPVSKAILMIEYSVVLAVAFITGSHGKTPLAAYVGVNMLSIILWGASLIFPSDEQKGSRFALWYVSIMIELLVNVAMKKNKQVSVAGSHLAERFGLFTLIILGKLAFPIFMVITAY
jgi:low temperature requirement protein LtrA